MDPASLLAGFGVIALSYLSLRFFRFVYLYARPSSLHRYRYGRESWCLVTGASDGIGLGFAQELAMNNFNVVLHGRNITKLQEVKSRLNHDFPNVQFRILVADTTSLSTAQLKDIVASVSDLNLTVLINNVGGSSVWKPFEDYTMDETDYVINLNARFPAQLTRALLPLLTRQSGPSLIINVGSLGTIGTPYVAPYSGGKAFLMSMSKSLDLELRTEKKSVEVLAVPVGKVTNTGSNSKDPVDFFTPDARTMARAALGRVGCGKAEVIGYIGHAVQQFVSDLLPDWVRESVMVAVMKGFKDDYMRKK